MFGFLRDKYAFIAVSTFVSLFIAFYVGGFLGDYNPDDLPRGALTAADIFGALFVLVFGILNLQASIVFAIIYVLVMVTLFFLYSGEGSSQNEHNKYTR